MKITFKMLFTCNIGQERRESAFSNPFLGNLNVVAQEEATIM